MPAKEPIEDRIVAEVLLKVGDDITTDHIMPAASNILIFRSNIPKLAEFVYHRVDDTFAGRAKGKGTGFIVGGPQLWSGELTRARCPGAHVPGNSRGHRQVLRAYPYGEPDQLGVDPPSVRRGRGLRQHRSGDELELSGVIDFVKERDTIELVNKTKNTQYQVRLVATPRERRVLIAGGRLSEAKAIGSR